jgi:glutathione S-transferase
VLEALSIPYEVKTFKRNAEKVASPELLAIHPLGKSPVITIERPEYSKPLVVAESGAIVDYLLDHFGGEEKGLVPKRYASEEDAAKNLETESWLRYKYYMYYIEGSLMPQLVTSLIIDGESFFGLPLFLPLYVDMCR